MGKGHAYEDNATDHWLTPPELLQSLGLFDLDPCAYAKQPWGTAKKHYALPECDGLLLPWDGRVWCNPPYGNETGKWMNRMALHRNGLMLVFARTETHKFRPAWDTGDALYFFYRRIAFRRPDGSKSDGGTAPSVLIAFGESNVESLRILKRTRFNGALVTKWEP